MNRSDSFSAPPKIEVDCQLKTHTIITIGFYKLSYQERSRERPDDASATASTVLEMVLIPAARLLLNNLS